MELFTERLSLTPFRLSDSESVFKYAKDPRVGPVAGWKPHESVSESEKVIKEILSVPETYAIRLDGNLIGCISLKTGTQTDLTDSPSEAEIGYWLGVPFWGRGFMTEALKRLIKHAFDDLKYKRLWAGYYDGNERSKRVQEKCGFKFHHTTYDLFVPQLNEYRTGHVNFLDNENGKK